MKTRLLSDIQDLDFVAPPRISGLVKTLAGVMLLTLAGMGFVVYRELNGFFETRQRLEDAQQQLQNLQKQAALAAAANSGRNTSSEQRKVSEKLSLILSDHPMQVFDHIESCTGEHWALLSIKPGNGEQAMRLVAEVQNSGALLQLMDCLDNTQAFSAVEVNTQTRLIDQPQQPMRVDLSLSN